MWLFPPEQKQNENQPNEKTYRHIPMRKLILLAMVAGLTGCGSMEREIRESSTPELQLRRDQVIYRINHAASMWGTHPWQHPDTEKDLEEKSMIERELLRRGAMPQYQPIPRIKYGGPEMHE
jgi:hypothetical protein